MIDDFRNFPYTFPCTYNHIVQCFIRFFSTEKEVNHMKIRLESSLSLEMLRINMSVSAYKKMLKSVKAQMNPDINVQYV